MRKLSKSLLQDITCQLNSGKSSRHIAQSLGCSKTKVNEVRSTLKSAPEKPRAGAPSKLSPKDKQEVSRLIRTKKLSNATEAARYISSATNKKVSADTIRRALDEHELVAKKKVKKPKLTQQHRRNRLRWAESHREWTIDDWKRVIWSDESKINIMNSDGLRYTWLPRDSAPAYEPTLKFGGGSIMVWGCMTYAGVGQLVRIDGKMDANYYCSVLQVGLLPTIDASILIPNFPEPQDIIFQQDNDPKHCSAKAKSWLSHNCINVMTWPSQSPDLNPIEHLWAYVKKQIGKLEERPRGVHELWGKMHQEWNNIPPAYVKS